MNAHLGLGTVATAALDTALLAALAVEAPADVDTVPVVPASAANQTLETLYFDAPTGGIAATHDGHKPIRPFPPGIARLDDPPLASAFVLLAKARDSHGRVVGFASEMEEVAAVSDIAQGRMIMRTTWTVQLAGRGTLFCHQVEDASEFARKVVGPALRLGTSWDRPWTFVTTVGPGPDGRGVIARGTGEFEGVTGSFVEVTHLRRFTPDGGMWLTMEL